MRDARRPDMRSGTLGIVEANEDMNMPPFAVDVIAGQGNGDMTDAVIALRGAISNDAGFNSWAPGAEDFSVPFVATNSAEARLIAAALEGAARVDPSIFRSLAVKAGEDDPAWLLNHLAERFKMVPGARA